MSRRSDRTALISIARETLRETEDFQAACVDVVNSDHIDRLGPFKDEEARSQYVEGIVRFAEHQLGWSR
jgi:hypothetical protein